MLWSVESYAEINACKKREREVETRVYSLRYNIECALLRLTTQYISNREWEVEAPTGSQRVSVRD